MTREQHGEPDQGFRAGIVAQGEPWAQRPPHARYVRCVRQVRHQLRQTTYSICILSVERMLAAKSFYRSIMFNSNQAVWVFRVRGRGAIQGILPVGQPAIGSNQAASPIPAWRGGEPPGDFEVLPGRIHRGTRATPTHQHHLSHFRQAPCTQILPRSNGPLGWASPAPSAMNASAA